MGTDFSRLPERLWFRVVVCLLIAIPVLRFHTRGVLGQFENLLYDVRVEMVANRLTVDDDIVIVAVDTQSLERMDPILGRWPWQRSVYAGVIDYCSQADVVVLDLLLVERDAFLPESDDLMVDMARRHPGLALCAFFSKPFAMEPGDGLRRYGHEVGPYPALREVAPGLGHVTYIPDRDGVVRRYMTAIDYEDRTVPSLALEAARLRLGLDLNQISIDGTGVDLGDRRIPLDGHGGLRLRYRLPTDYEACGIPIADIIESMQDEMINESPLVSRDVFAGKVVFIGSTAIGLSEDRKVTPVARAEPGVLINADAYQNLMHGESFRILPNWARLILVGLGLLVPALPRLVRPTAMAGVFFVAIALYLTTVVLAARGASLMLPVTGPLVGLGLSVGVLSLMSWFTERLRRRRLESLERAKQRFTDMLVHDLKGQMAGVMMSLDMIDRNVGEESAVTRKLVQTAHGTGNRLLTQIHALLDIRRMQEGRMPLSPQPSAVGELFFRCLREYQPAAELLGVSIEIVDPVPLDRLLISADPELFERILGNLVWNALQYAAQGTVIELAAAPEARTVNLSVANQGKVIPAAKQDEVFLDFVSGRIDEKTHQVASSGLGLAFCKLAADAHGGRIWIESPWRDGTGVKVILAIPRAHGS